uniref:Uncharacterized protein n=1 Tax=uncultured marine group II/III euryarchaeote KM3_88_E02 TaxID=1456536 RepID=A0A075HX47_9EURY|nr:hypothetical protein [uncultured marine group II/III euryarchaeote KM3_88_E02]
MNELHFLYCCVQNPGDERPTSLSVESGPILEMRNLPQTIRDRDLESFQFHLHQYRVDPTNIHFHLLRCHFLWQDTDPANRPIHPRRCLSDWRNSRSHLQGSPVRCPSRRPRNP